jgi:hypothetical protein
VSRLAPLSLGELIEHWTLRDDEAGLVAVKHGDTRLAFELLRFYGRYGRFPRNRGELHPDAVEFMARAVKADPADLAGYDWSGRTVKRHRTEIRQHFGFWQCTGRGRALTMPRHPGPALRQSWERWLLGVHGSTVHLPAGLMPRPAFSL